MALAKETLQDVQLVVGTEVTLYGPDINPGVYRCRVDLSALLTGDTVQLRKKVVCNPGSTVNTAALLEEIITVNRPTTDPTPAMYPFLTTDSNYSITYTAKQTAGTARKVSIAVMRLV